ncbi:hypothetical protein EXIGLDRAFT_836653 [Exidia glandulosa HHB12029]|uniref:Elongin-A n=1 Tax=Exidia glandulosa HHB12029 TaxID=1314781 RepID=A0A165HM80_EXIGL|nr:hypothetical protein EXIGLDRAFT_836653 [Exidia glandulosa HHB12029]
MELSKPSHVSTQNNVQILQFRSVAFRPGALSDFTLTGHMAALQCPTLSQYCHRVVAKNIDFLDDIDNVPYHLLKPVLVTVSAQSLLRLERKAPHIALEDEGTPSVSYVWHALCLREFPSADLEDADPDSWRDFYQELKEEAESRIEQAASRMRHLRDEERALKRARQIVVTDKPPPARRGRGGPVRPKTLFEKTRKEARKASKIHTGMSMTVPPPPRSATIAFEPRRAPLPTSASTTAPSTSASPAHNMTLSPVRPISASPVRRPPASSPAKDPLAKLFMPKHRAYSQLPQRT